MFSAKKNNQAPFDQLKKVNAGKGKAAARIIVVIVVLLVLVMESYYSIQEEEQAVVCTFGSPKAVTTPGLHFKIPFIQTVDKVNTTIQGFSIGYHAEGEEDDAMMITSDYNFIFVDFYAEYRVTDPVKALYASHDPEEILKNIAQNCIRTTIGSYSVDSVLTTGKNEIQSNIKQMILDKLEDYDAEATKQERINEANGQAARFNSMYQEYAKYPEVTKKRMFYEAMEHILPEVKVVIQSKDGSMSTVLPLDSFVSDEDSSDDASDGQSGQAQAKEATEED